MKKIYYEKRGRRYVPVAEYDNELLDSFTKGYHLVSVYPGGSSRRFNIEPAYAPMIAASRVAEDAICSALSKASEVKPPRRAMTQDEMDAWNHLIKVWGDEARTLHGTSHRDIAEAGVKAMIQEADKLMQHEGVRRSYEQFMLMCQLVKENDK